MLCLIHTGWCISLGVLLFVSGQSKLKQP